MLLYWKQNHQTRRIIDNKVEDLQFFIELILFMVP